MNQSNSCRNRKNSSDQAGASPRFLTAILLFLLFPLLVIANPPSWWTEQQVVNSNAAPNDYAAINQGQLKHLSKQAYLHMQIKLPPSIWTSAAGTNLTAFIQGFQTNSPYNYNAVNLGQLKNTAKKFYDVLNAAGYTNTAFATPYPWTGHEAQVNNYAMANIGQAKNLFSFDLSQFLPLSVKQQIVDADLNDGITSVNQVFPGDDFDNDGVANLSEYQQGGDPTNYYSQGSQTIVPVLTIVSGNDQTSLPSEFLSSPLIIKMENGTGAALANAPVSFSVTAGNGRLALSNVGAPQTSSSLIVRTGLDGQAQVYYQQPSIIGTESHVMAQAGTAIPVQFTLKTAIPAPTGVRLWYYYSHVALFWNSSTAIPIDSYEIQQSVDGNTWTSLGIVDGNTHFFVIPSLTSGVNNLFKVIAKSGAINSEPAIASVSAGPSLRPETINVTLRAGEGYDRLLSVLNNQLNSSNLTITASGAGVSEKGYSWEDSDMSGGPAYVWNDISTTGTKLNVISETDDDYESFSIPFSFPFYSNSYTQIYVSSNGYITLGTGSSNYQNSSLPDANAPANIIAPLWDDLRTSTDGDIYYLNEADKTTIQFENVATNNGSGNYTFQIVLHKNGEIDFYYKSLTGALDSSTVGLQNSDGSIGALVSYNQNYLKNNFAVRFTKSWLYLFTSGSQELQAGGMQTLNVWFSALGLEAGTHTASIAVTSGNETLTLPITLNVVASGQSDLDDSDNDQLLDWWELKHWGDLSQNGTGDFDGDGILNATEYANGTNPLWGNPSITITTPINEGQYELHSSILVSASISNIPAVSAVYFYLNGSLQIGMKTVLPYQTTVENIGFGDYTISAVVYTLTGESYSSNVVTIHVPNPYDTNGLPLAWEMQYFGHTGVSATGDADNDGVSNWDEYINGSNPTIADTDGDGFSDSDENSAGSNSNNSSDTPDNSTQLTVKVGISDQDFNDDIWSLSVETSDEDGNFTGSNSDVVDNQGNPHGTSYGTTHIDYGKSVKFTMGRIEAGQYRGTDEYTASFEPQGSEEKKKRWLSESDNSSLSNSLPWTGDGSTPPDPSSLKWVYTVPLADLSILKSDGSEVPESQEETPGWVVAPRQSDGTLATQLKLHKIKPTNLAGKYTLRVDGSRVLLWKDSAGTQAIDSTTELDASTDTIVYAEAVSGNSSTAEKVYISWKNANKGQELADADKINLIIPLIEPDSGQAGTTGDMVASIVTSSTAERHYVSPKEASDYVVLKVNAPGVTAANFASLLEWDTTAGEAVSGSADKWKASRSNPDKIVVKLKRVGDHVEVARLNVWIVWATGSITNLSSLNKDVLRNVTSCIDGSISTSTELTTNATWTFVFTISPSSLTDINTDIPDLRGSNTVNVPGSGTHSPSPGTGDLAGGADSKWDVSRRYSFVISNPASIPREKFISGFGTIYSDAVPNGTVVSIAPSLVVGNDDAGVGDEDNNPYVANSNPGESHSVGQLSSRDTPTLLMPDAGGTEGNTFEQNFLPQEFVRLQIGNAWYLVSDSLSWSLKEKLKFQGGQWRDNGSTVGSGN